ncbi:hypothetical protein GCM10025865_22870 [Paraoerskovia sediminicola]|uniref:Uncharacterized protein n=1 Tax=Paraoerskovia sediminicola TaxID=1138587 RepID=A0ABM8G4I5_9CELL|nr:hypothetical protein GCM10025865_22870 [Paraoerskovia sediminicola]
MLGGERPEVGRDLRVRLVRGDPHEDDDGVLRRVLDDLGERLVGDVDDVAALLGCSAGLARGRCLGAVEGGEVDGAADVERGLGFASLIPAL